MTHASRLTPAYITSTSRHSGTNSTALAIAHTHRVPPKRLIAEYLCAAQQSVSAMCQPEKKERLHSSAKLVAVKDI